MNENKEDYVSFECAKLLKEKGFDWKCDKQHIEKRPETEREEWDEVECQYKTIWNVIRTPIPTLWKAVKWLRSLGLHILVDFDVDGKWLYKVFRIGGLCVHEGNGGFPTYESALLAGIEAALRLI